MGARHLPQRSCVGCRAIRNQRELVRVVRSATGQLLVDPMRRMAGRGAYLCPRAACVRRALKQKGLERALRGPVNPDTGAALQAEIAPFLKEE